MADTLFREGMQVPSPDEGPTYGRLNDYTIQGKILKILQKAGMNMDVTGFEMYHQKGKLLVTTKEGFSIEFRRGEHYIGKGGTLKFLPETKKYIEDSLKKYNDQFDKKGKIKSQTHAALDGISSEVQTA